MEDANNSCQFRNFDAEYQVAAKPNNTSVTIHDDLYSEVCMSCTVNVKGCDVLSPKYMTDSYCQPESAAVH